jgi:hypothetical protein
MTLRVVGAGLGRTGTHSLKIALEQLLGGRCYHMSELFDREPDTEVWERAARGAEVDWDPFLADFAATVDWPASAFWEEIAAAVPDAMVLLSVRESGEAWWTSMERTIISTLQVPVPPGNPSWHRRRAMVLAMLDARFTPDWADRDAAIAAYERHNQHVRDTVPPERLVEWRPGDGWEPICTALSLDVPAAPFPHTNTTAEFRDNSGLS